MLIDLEYINQDEKDLVELFLSSKNVKRYILGINKLSRALLKVVEVDGIVDDFTRVQRSRKKEVLSIEQVPKDAIILSTATGSPLEVKERLEKMGLTHLSYLTLYKYSDLDLIAPPFMSDFYNDYKENKSLYSKLYSDLADEKSRVIFERLINFKISFDYAFMEGFTNDHEGQYFDKEILPPLKNIKFLDGGGYVGDTAQEVIKNYPDFEKIWVVEPISENMRLAKRTLSEYSNIEFVEFGLSNKKEKLYFNDEKSFSTLYGNGTESVDVDTIDNIVKERVDFIKLDIEGAEQSAIEGAKETIKRYNPILAICIYHRAEDWYKIPQMVLEIEPNYDIYLRHYMEGIFESVLYFIPKK